MPKIKLTKSEAKKQKEALKRFRRYLPMLQLKKKQLQLEISKVQRAIEDLRSKVEKLRNEITVWVDVFAESVGIEELIGPWEVKIEEGNIAGIDIPIFAEVLFAPKKYDLFLTPLWVDEGIEAIKEMIISKAELEIGHRQLETLRNELQVVTQRVNLFEKVKIPKTKENIRTIHIYLGDLRTAEVVRGKIAKAKIEKRKNLA
ncbi:MAG: V-type ATP synthase subunit D [Candidatus Omnitrophica bacterium]|nr:V-type ATP synthase subunit D [Candidatus Omnitrophota bacterium]